MAGRYLLYDLNQGGFLTAGPFDKAYVSGYDDRSDISHASIFSDTAAREHGLSPYSESDYLQIPLTDDMVSMLPFELEDEEMNEPFPKSVDNEAAKQGDFFVLTPLGFYGEKLNSALGTSHTKLSGFELSDATLYNMETLEKCGSTHIMEPSMPGGRNSEIEYQPILIPVSEVQKEKLKMLPEFDVNMSGSFLEPVREAGNEQGFHKDLPVLPDLGEALESLEEEQKKGAEL